MNDTTPSTPCTCTTCPGTACTCGCQKTAAETAQQAVCACGPRCPCGPACNCPTS